MNSNMTRRRQAAAMIAGSTICLLGGSSAAFAHHAMDGRLPATFMEGLLSGLAHPVIGPDHLAFIIAIGIAAAVILSGIGLIASFIAASFLGLLAHVARIDIPLTEPLIAFSVIAAGALIAAAKSTDVARSSGVWLALGVGAGLLHGYAFGESIVGAHRVALHGYLIGLAIVSAAIAITAMLVVRRLLETDTLTPARIRIAGAGLGVIGTLLLVASMVSAT